MGRVVTSEAATAPRTWADLIAECPTWQHELDASPLWSQTIGRASAQEGRDAS